MMTCAADAPMPVHPLSMTTLRMIELTLKNPPGPRKRFCHLQVSASLCYANLRSLHWNFSETIVVQAGAWGQCLLRRILLHWVIVSQDKKVTTPLLPPLWAWARSLNLPAPNLSSLAPGSSEYPVAGEIYSSQEYAASSQVHLKGWGSSRAQRWVERALSFRPDFLGAPAAQ